MGKKVVSMHTVVKNGTISSVDSLEASTVSEYSICSCNSGNNSDVSKLVDCSFWGKFSKNHQVGTSGIM
jgi:hypothetical protein